MTRCIVAASAPLWLIVAGCLEEQHPFTVPTNPAIEPIVARSLNQAQRAPATEEAAKRVITIGQKLVIANPQLGLRPAFCTVGTPDPEIFHRGTGGLEGCQVIISEGLVRRSTSEAQLAAVLAHEVGAIIVERESLMGSQRPVDRRLPPDAPIGNDVGGAFGPPDGTRMMEEAKLEKQQRHPAAPLSSNALARLYLGRAGYDVSELDHAQALLREAESNFSVEKSWGGQPGKPAVSATPSPPASKTASPLAPREPDPPAAPAR